MRLEVLWDSGGAVYDLDRAEILVGSSGQNDIVLNAQGISKNHVKLTVSQDQKIFVMDQGSTNGSFINDDRLIPGSKKELQFNEYLRLGDNVVINLLEDGKESKLPSLPLHDRSVVEEIGDKTQVVSLKKLKRIKTARVKKKSLKKFNSKLKKDPVKEKDNALMSQGIITAALVVFIGWAGMKYLKYKNPARDRKTIVMRLKETQIIVDDLLESFEEPSEGFRISNESLLQNSEIAEYSYSTGCQEMEERFFCTRIGKTTNNRNAAVNVNGQLIVFVDKKKYLERGQMLFDRYEEMSKRDGQKPTKTKPDFIFHIAFLSFLKSQFDGHIFPEIKPLNIYFVFYSPSASGKQIEKIFALKGSSISLLTYRYSDTFFTSKRYSPLSIVNRLRRFYLMYE